MARFGLFSGVNWGSGGLAAGRRMKCVAVIQLGKLQIRGPLANQQPPIGYRISLPILARTFHFHPPKFLLLLVLHIAALSILRLMILHTACSMLSIDLQPPSVVAFLSLLAKSL